VELKLKGSHQLLVCGDDNLLGDVTHNTKKNTEALLDVNKEVGLGVNTDKNNVWLYLEI
jgi:hypothetical protein